MQLLNNFNCFQDCVTYGLVVRTFFALLVVIELVKSEKHYFSIHLFVPNKNNKKHTYEWMAFVETP